MKYFNNRENKAYNINGKLIWESRSVAVSGTIIIEIENEKYVLSGKRGSNAADNKGYWNLICGYLDWDENLQEAMEREIWEESGLDLNILKKNLILDNLSFPWRVDSNPNSNRQNVTIHFGCLSKQNYFPKLNTENNEVLNETEELKWININEIDKFDWAFNHNKIIKKYIFSKNSFKNKKGQKDQQKDKQKNIVIGEMNYPPTKDWWISTFKKYIKPI